MKRLLLACLLMLPGCHLGELLNPSPPPPPARCWATVQFIFVNSWGDTTRTSRTVEVECPDAP